MFEHKTCAPNEPDVTIKPNQTHLTHHSIPHFVVTSSSQQNTPNEDDNCDSSFSEDQTEDDSSLGSFPSFTREVGMKNEAEDPDVDHFC